MTDEPLYQERLVKMGWLLGDDGVFVRQVAATPDVELIFENFTAHLEEMVLQSARVRPTRWEVGLEAFLDRVEGTGLNWWLYGSGALAVRGIEVEPGDLDFAVDDAMLAGEQWTGRAFYGATLEWLAGAHPSGSSPPHEQEPAARAHLEAVTWRGRYVPVPELGLQLAVANQRGLRDRARLIHAARTG